jgi:hypothetical protein
MVMAAMLVVSAVSSVGAGAAAATSVRTDGYWMLEQNGIVHGFGGADVVSHRWISDGALVVGMWTSAIAAHPLGHGYWVGTSWGEVDGFDGAPQLETDSPWMPPGVELAWREGSVAILPTASGEGYRNVSSCGRVAVAGDAVHLGDLGALVPSREDVYEGRAGPPACTIVSAAQTPSGRGYWLVDGAGAVYAFGDAVHRGDAGRLPLQRPIVGIAPTPTGKGYWLVASDGGIFTYGDAVFRGSMGNVPLNRPIVGLISNEDGYLMVASDGGIFTFGHVDFHGSLGATPPDRPITAVAASPVPTKGSRP